MNEMEMERYTSQRWRPTEDQVKMMTHIYNYGVTHPSRAQVVEIASRLRVFADATEYNVHCWFNNHGNRVRRWQAEVDPTGTQFSQLPLYMYGTSSSHWRTSVLFHLVNESSLLKAGGASTSVRMDERVRGESNSAWTSVYFAWTSVHLCSSERLFQQLLKDERSLSLVGRAAASFWTSVRFLNERHLLVEGRAFAFIGWTSGCLILDERPLLAEGRASTSQDERPLLLCGRASSSVHWTNVHLCS
ncbi:hypothetical protein LR48_Vigan10g120300 [Vigna angularis]|uniref:Homeobox domain-containing protein n=1 Tax=Phaseolus angularis TaxID=3914 RepID=A0A0L9VJT2_PHAAN|nr:hypothetical protein LR48_Vigan10g120300 [Vigna angularis]